MSSEITFYFINIVSGAEKIETDDSFFLSPKLWVEEALSIPFGPCEKHPILSWRAK